MYEKSKNRKLIKKLKIYFLGPGLKNKFLGPGPKIGFHGPKNEKQR